MFCTDDCISVIVSRYTLFTENFCDLLSSSHQTFLLEVLDHQCVFQKERPCNVGPLAYFAVSVLREVCENTVFT